jgi:hypothetical protein
VNAICWRVATEVLGHPDLLDGLVVVVIDEVKYKKGQRYLPSPPTTWPAAPASAGPDR